MESKRPIVSSKADIDSSMLTMLSLYFEARNMLASCTVVDAYASEVGRSAWRKDVCSSMIVSCELTAFRYAPFRVRAEASSDVSRVPTVRICACRSDN